MAKVKLLYFAWVRERIGRSEETLDLPEQVSTVQDLVAWLSSRGEEYTAAFEKPDIIRAAIDQQHVPHETAIDSAREIAFFPPVTGG